MQEKIRAKFSSIGYIFCAFIKQTEVFKNIWFFSVKGAFFNHVDKSLAFYDHLPFYDDIFYLMRVNKKSTFLHYTFPPPLVNVIKECSLSMTWFASDIYMFIF